MKKKINIVFGSLIIILLGNCGGGGQSSVSQPIAVALANKPQETQLVAPSKTIKEMNFEEAFNAKVYYDKQKEDYASLQCALRMVTLGSNKDNEKEEIQKLTLYVAKRYLDDGDFEKSQKHASDYELLYPGSPEVKEASYLALKAQFLSTLEADRDQSKTKQALSLAQNFNSKYKDDNQYGNSVKDIEHACYQKIFDSEVGVAKCYLARFNYTQEQSSLNAAVKRVAFIKEKIMPNVKEQERELLHLELALAEAKQSNDLIKEKQEELAQKYPEESPGFIAKAIRKVALKF